MVTITLDETIRKTLNKFGLPLHYYIKFLVIARDGLREMKYTVLPAEKTVELTIDANNEVDIPNDFVGEVGLYRKRYDKMIPIPHNPLISSYNGSPFDKPEDDMTLTYANELLENVGMQFGQVNQREDGYRIIPELGKIRIDNSTKEEKVYLKYVTMPQLVNNKTLIHPYVEPALVSYIAYQLAFYASERDMMFKRSEFYHQLRLLKSNLSRISIADILTSFRMYHNQTVKS